MAFNTRDAAAGLIFVVLAALFAAGSLQLELGTPLRMGPGYFPLVLSGILAVFGIAIIVRSLREAPQPVGAAPLRGLPLILAAPIVFGLTVRGLGLVPAVALVVLLSSFASRRMGVALALALTVGLTAFCVLVFSYGLGLPIRLFGPWLGV